MDGHHLGDRKGPEGQNPAYRPAHRHHTPPDVRIVRAETGNARRMGLLEAWDRHNQEVIRRQPAVHARRAEWLARHAREQQR